MSAQKMLIHTLLASASIIAMNTFASEYALTMKGSIFAQVGQEKGVDPLLLYSIGVAESGTGVGNGLMRPEPLVIRYSGGAEFFSSLDEAIDRLTEVLKTTRNVDVGMMQINLRQHPQENPHQLFDKAYNLTVAAEILKTAMSSTTDPIIGVGRYHHWADMELSRWYGERVWQIYNNLKFITDLDE